MKVFRDIFAAMMIGIMGGLLVSTISYSFPAFFPPPSYYSGKFLRVPLLFSDTLKIYPFPSTLVIPLLGIGLSKQETEEEEV